MMYVAAAGVVMNGVIAALLWGVARDVNLRSAFLHMAGDTLSTAAVIAGGAGILLTGQNWIDPVLSLIIAALILWSSGHRARNAEHPAGRYAAGRSHLTRSAAGMEGVAGVINVHDLHVLDPRIAVAGAGLSRDHRRHSAHRRARPSWRSCTMSSKITSTSATRPSSSSTRTAR